ncbi:class I SAM-dependent RNA methyltransferase [Mesomycoplasma neurolyticum]|uniref:RNA methyltransferase protein n=1 Tax=Mesomycoplasma neurolyticum TaxID=2120 RepID=A0A449A4C1_9BACT|nr:methyltransferase domain-containing protein [Mesomycoplasma neurolyticum]VEU59130.1 RNA methyltransferase protein [Mesomycoplasma neurolyticum]
MFVCTIEFYNQKGQGACKWNNKIVYISHVILNEKVDFTIVKEFKNHCIGKVNKIISPSKNRNYDLPNNFEQIGGYELFHMNIEAEKEYKIINTINAFKQNAKYELKNIGFFQGAQILRYRNKITLFDGKFYKPNSKELIKIDDFLLTDISPKTDKKGKVIFRKLDTLIIGHKKDNLYTTDTMFGIKFRVGINSFYQINKEVALEAYKDMLNFINKNDLVYDFYSGIGTISLLAAQKVKKVIAVEYNKNSHQDALFNAKNNNIKNVRFYLENVETFLQKQKQILNGTLIVDPSREGLNKNIIELILKHNFKKIIYLSCNVFSQAGDFFVLKNHYNLVFSKIYNMFPRTYHIENLIVLEKKGE